MTFQTRNKSIIEDTLSFNTTQASQLPEHKQ